MNFQLIWDFDHTMVDDNSDTFIIKQLDTDTYDRFLDAYNDLEWNSMMDLAMTWLYEKGFKLSDIRKGLEQISVDQDTINTIRKYHTSNHKMYIVSDANTFFIDSILEHLQLTDHFDEIHTNPIIFEGECLRIKPYHTNHGCQRCRPNMCKALIVDKLPNPEGVPRVYLGDGKGDFCAVLSLTDKDHALVRKGYQLEKTINESKDKIKATIHFWSTGKDIANYLNQLKAP